MTHALTNELVLSWFNNFVGNRKKITVVILKGQMPTSLSVILT